MKLVIYTGNCVGNAKNCLYPTRREITSGAELAEAVKLDHVCAEYADNYRSIDNFRVSNVVVMDVDNDHTENASEWIDADKLDKLMPDIAFAWAPSRHNYLDKESFGPRPRGHVYFLTSEIRNAEQYANLKKAIHAAYPFFDDNALDAARFIYGADTGEVVWHDGWVTIDEEILPEAAAPEDETYDSKVIAAGSRNNTMSRFAGRVLKRYGDTDKAHEAFLEHAKRCDPPLDDEELSAIWGSAVKFYKKVEKQDGYVHPDEYNADFVGASLKPDDYSDIGEAKVFIREYGDELRYTDATEYLRYDGTCWRENRQSSVGAVEEFLDLQLQDSLNEVQRCMDALVFAGVDEVTVKAGGKELQKAVPAEKMGLLFALLGAQTYYKFVMRYRNFRNIANTLSAAKPMVAIDINDLDQNEFLLNTPDSTINLKEGLSGVQEHSPDDLITKITSCSAGDDGKRIWEDSLNLFFCHDQALIDYVQEIVGMAAVGKVYLEALIIAYGEGRNGKSTFWNTISRVLGTYAGNMSADTLTVGCRRNVKPEMAELKGKRLIIAAELEEGMRLSTSVLKQLCSTDVVYAEKKFKDPFGFVPSHTVVLYTNHLPKVGASDEGTWRRLIVIPFQAKIEGRSDIKNYSDYLFQNAGPYIMRWIVEGAQKAIRHEFKIPLPPVVQDAISEYRGQNDWLGHFLTECCEIGDGLEQKSGELYQEYRSYCLRTGEYTRSTTDFYAALEKAGFSRKKKKSGMWVQGVQVKVEDFLE